VDYDQSVKSCVSFYTQDLKEAYLQNFLDIEGNSELSEAAKAFKAYQKVEIFLHGQKFDIELKE
jgi:hypothetical protein